MKRHGNAGVSNSANNNTLAALALLAAVGWPMAAVAQNVYTWDSSGANPGHPVDGSGNWDLTSGLWSNGSSDIAWPNNSNAQAAFGNGGTAGTVTLQSPILARGVTFNPVSSGSYTIASASPSDTLTMLSVIANVNGTISAPIAGSAGLTTSGAATLNLSGANTYTGNTVINSGTLQLGAANTLPATTGVIVNSGGTFDTNNLAQTISTLTGTGAVNLESGSNLTLNESTNATFSGQIVGSGTITKQLAGFLTLTAAEPNFTGTFALNNTLSNTLVLSGNANINNASIAATMDNMPNGGGVQINFANLTTPLTAPITYNTVPPTGSNFNVGSDDLRFSFNASGGTANAVASPIVVTFENTGTYTSNPSLVFTSNNGSLAVSSNITINSDAVNGQIVFRGSQPESFSGKISAPAATIIATTDAGLCQFAPQSGSTYGSIHIGGTYTLAISSDAAVAGAADVTGGTNGVIFGGGTLRLNNYTSTLNFIQANDSNTTTDPVSFGAATGSPSTYAGSLTLTGSNPVNFVGPGTLILSGSLSYSGATNVNGGTMQLGASNILPGPVGGSGGTALTVAAGATFDLNNNYQAVKSLAGAGNILLTGSNSELDLDTSTGTFSGSISGAGQFDIVGGSLTLSGNNTYTGETYIGGTLTVGSTTAIPAASDVADFGTLAIGAFNPTLGSLSGFGAVTGTGNLTVGANNNNQVFGGVIKTTGGSVTLTGTSTWTLVNTSTYTGATNINSGTLQIGTTNALPTNTVLNIASAGTLDLNSNAQQVGELLGSGNILLSGPLTVGGVRSDSNFSGNITGNSQFVVAESGNTLYLTGNNSYTGDTLLASGTLAINSDAAINNGAGGISFTGGVLQFQNYTSNLSFGNGASLGAAAGAPSTLAGAVTGSTLLGFSGPGTLILINTGNNYTGGTSIGGGNIQFAVGAFPGATHSIFLYGGAVNITGAFPTVASALPYIESGSYGAVALMGDSSESINLSGNSQLSLGAGVNSTYTGTLTPYTGMYYLGGGSATLTLPNNNALTGSGNDLTVGVNGIPGTVVLSGSNNFSGDVTLAGGTLAITSDAAINNGADIGFNGGTLQFNNYNSTMTGGIIGVTAPVSIGAATGTPSTMNLTIPSGAAFTYQGPGTLLLGSNTVLSSTAALVVNAGTLDLNGNSQTVGTLAGAGNINIESGATLTASAAGSTTYSGVMSGTGGFIRNNTGTFSITGANTLTGPVNITQNGSTTATTLTLSGNGSFNNSSLLTLTNTSITGGNFGVSLSNLAAPMSVPIDIVTPTTGGDYRVGINNIAGNNTITSPTTLNAGENGTNVSTLTYSSAANTLMTISSTVTIPSTNGAKAITTSPVGSNGPTLTVDGQLGFRGVGATSTQVIGIFNGLITGPGASSLLIAKTDPGAWYWDPQPGTVFGAVTFGIGTLQMGEANALSSSLFYMTGSSAVLDLNGFNQTISALASSTSGNTITSTNGPATLTIAVSTTSNYTFGGGTTDSITGPVAITIASTNTGTETFNEPNTYTGGTNLNGGTLIFSALTDLGAGPISFSGGTIQYAGTTNTSDLTTNGLTINSGGGTINTVANTVTFANAVTGTGTLAKIGTGTLILSSPATLGGITAGAGTLHLAAVGNTFTGNITINGSSTLQLDGNTTAAKLAGDGTGTLKLTAGKLAATAQAQSTLSLASLSISPGAVLDIDNGNIAVFYGTGTDPITTVAGYIAAGYDYGRWDGVSPSTGAIISTASIGHATALGYLDNTTTHEVEIKYTWYGDLNLDGVVNSADAAMMGAEGTGNVGWSGGDLNYDGQVNADDYSLFFLGDASQNGTITAGVPEPTAAMLALALPALSLRRRRSKQ